MRKNEIEVIIENTPSFVAEFVLIRDHAYNLYGCRETIAKDTVLCATGYTNTYRIAGGRLVVIPANRVKFVGYKLWYRL